jgi:hypothetical protein
MQQATPASKVSTSGMRRSNRGIGMTAVFAVMLASVIVFLLLTNTKSTSLLGTWTNTGNNAVATATIAISLDTSQAVQQSVDMIDGLFSGIICGSLFPARVEFRSDGTVIFGTASTTTGSMSMSYETIDGSRIRLSAGGQTVVYGYSVDGNKLTLTYQGCPDTYYSK